MEDHEWLAQQLRGLLWKRKASKAGLALMEHFAAAGVPKQAQICRICREKTQTQVFDTPLGECVTDHLLDDSHFAKLTRITDGVMAKSPALDQLVGFNGVRVQKWTGADGSQVWLNHITGECGREPPVGIQARVDED